MEKWYALRVRSNHERAVQSALRYRGIEEFLPVYSRKSRWSDRVKRVDLPLFPGYVFSRFDAQRRLPVLMVPGVVQVVGTAAGPVPVDDRELQAIRRFVDSGMALTPWQYLACGETVSVDSGPLAGMEGILLRVESESRLVVSLTLLQRSVAVRIDSACVRPSAGRERHMGRMIEQCRAALAATAPAL